MYLMHLVKVQLRICLATKDCRGTKMCKVDKLLTWSFSCDTRGIAGLLTHLEFIGNYNRVTFLVLQIVIARGGKETDKIFEKYLAQLHI